MDNREFRNHQLVENGDLVNNQAVIFGGGDIAGGYGVLLTSPDGTEWTSRASSWNLSAVTWAGNRYVAVGTRTYFPSPPYSVSLVVTSPDGITWQQQDSKPGFPHMDQLSDIIWMGSYSWRWDRLQGS